jgi:hypothetical protein
MFFLRSQFSRLFLVLILSAVLSFGSVEPYVHCQLFITCPSYMFKGSISSVNINNLLAFFKFFIF